VCGVGEGGARHKKAGAALSWTHPTRSGSTIRVHAWMGKTLCETYREHESVCGWVGRCILRADGVAETNS
jgi:hypothetical protein